MQWLDIRAMGTANAQCAGFGAQNVVSTARVRAEGTALTSPDVWDLGVGVQPGSYIDGKCAPAKALACAQPPSSDGGASDVSISSDAMVTVDVVPRDLPSAPEAGAPDTAGSEANAVDLSGDRVSASGTVDAAAYDAALVRDAPADTTVVDGSAASADRVPVAPDAGADRAAGAADASPDTKGDGASPNSDGCGCYLGGRPAGSHTSWPAGLVLFAALAGLAVVRRARR